MDQNNKIRLVEEEEKSGWTILSTVHDEEPEEKLPAAPETDPEPIKGADEPVRGADDSALSEEKSKENEDSDDAEEVLYSEGDDYADDELTDYGVDDGAEEGGSPFSNSAREYVWESEPVRDAGVEQTLVEQQPGQKQGLIWRASLVATLGFFGWAVLCGLGGGGKNVRCLKLHPCSLKEGEPVLSTL
ncbi:hypothetical protein GOP47_0013008 [Adiantum capillus-veneris]|uniref:Uncharacterized protein n=1 Tax=Adiantum capillus-veneris TaxID=13818 RepID=A0A9D4USA2_ADICA|nr:hypothetical protein GOP47_0013008 [Adiantum capillus-veneris]